MSETTKHFNHGQPEKRVVTTQHRYVAPCLLLSDIGYPSISFTYSTPPKRYGSQALPSASRLSSNSPRWNGPHCPIFPDAVLLDSSLWPPIVWLVLLWGSHSPCCRCRCSISCFPDAICHIVSTTTFSHDLCLFYFVWFPPLESACPFRSGAAQLFVHKPNSNFSASTTASVTFGAAIYHAQLGGLGVKKGGRVVSSLCLPGPDSLYCG